MSTSYVLLETLAPGDRFTFYGIPEAGPHTLIHVGKGRATIRPDRHVDRTRTFETRAGESVTVPVGTSLDEPCALGAQVVRV